jgi:hypothetical protein
MKRIWLVACLLGGCAAAQAEYFNANSLAGRSVYALLEAAEANGQVCHYELVESFIPAIDDYLCALDVGGAPFEQDVARYLGGPLAGLATIDPWTAVDEALVFTTVIFNTGYTLYVLTDGENVILQGIRP